MSLPLAWIVEDEADLAQIFSVALRAAGFESEIISRGDRALERLAEVVPTLILLDLHLPGVDGGKLLRQIRADERLAGTRVIVASADAAFADALNVEADLVLLKPVSFGQLRDLAQRFLAAGGEQ